jgi:hypothetical protein
LQGNIKLSEIFSASVLHSWFLATATDNLDFTYRTPVIASRQANTRKCLFCTLRVAFCKHTRVAKKQLAAKIRRYSYLEMKNAYPAVTVFSANP